MTEARLYSPRQSQEWRGGRGGRGVSKSRQTMSATKTCSTRNCICMNCRPASLLLRMFCLRPEAEDREHVETALITTTSCLTEGDDRNYIAEKPFPPPISHVQKHTTGSIIALQAHGVCGTNVVCWVYLWPPPATSSHAVPATPAPTKDGTDCRDYMGCGIHCEWAGR